jgi:hypothetical protein
MNCYFNASGVRTRPSTPFRSWLEHEPSSPTPLAVLHGVLQNLRYFLLTLARKSPPLPAQSFLMTWFAHELPRATSPQLQPLLSLDRHAFSVPPPPPPEGLVGLDGLDGAVGVAALGDVTGDVTGGEAAGDNTGDAAGELTGELTGDAAGLAAGDAAGLAAGEAAGLAAGPATVGDAAGEAAGDATGASDGAAVVVCAETNHAPFVSLLLRQSARTSKGTSSCRCREETLIFCNEPRYVEGDAGERVETQDRRSGEPMAFERRDRARPCRHLSPRSCCNFSNRLRPYLFGWNVRSGWSRVSGRGSLLVVVMAFREGTARRGESCRTGSDPLYRSRTDRVGVHRRELNVFQIV